MDDLSSRLGDLLKNPENMEKIKNLAAMFGGDGAAEEPEPEAPAPRRAPQPSPRRESEGAGGLP
ncbi:MAG: hypothetical protein LKJ59_03025, partial [Oscillospiraceae bacterium]|nr:hypothetical protein [Oscillospiraceae bacterium]